MLADLVSVVSKLLQIVIEVIRLTGIRKFFKQVYLKPVFDPERAVKFLAAFMEGMSSLADGEVWFMIHERYGRYQIGLYYDNLHNQAHGEDL